jgi:hypothetical protein
MMRRSLPAGVFLMAAGIVGYPAIRHWMATRIFVPVDMPVSLKRGHIRTGPFLINLRATYSVWLDWDWTRPRAPNCDEPVETRWILSSGGRVVPGSNAGLYPEFRLGSGIYDLDLEVLKDASCLDSAFPTLQMRTDASVYEDYLPALSWLSLICAGVGASLLLMSARGRLGKAPAADVVCAGAGGGRYRLVPKVARRRVPAGLPSFGLVAGTIYMLVMLTMMVLQSWVFHSRVGLRVHLLKPEPRLLAVRGIQPLYVRLEWRGVNLRPGLFVDSLPVAWEDLGKVVESGLLRRPPGWPVYFEADRDVEWEFAVKAMDVIRGCRAEVTLVTRR